MVFETESKEQLPLRAVGIVLLCINIFLAQRLLVLLEPRSYFIEHKLPKLKQIHISSSNRGGRVVIHIGPHKTGSTAIQSSLNSDVYRESLVSDNYILLPVQHGFTMKKVLKNCFDGYCPDNVIQQIRKAKKNKLSKNIVISSEQFDYYRPIEKIQSFLDDFRSIQIVVVYRRFYEWLPSQYSQMRRGQWHGWQTLTLFLPTTKRFAG